MTAELGQTQDPKALVPGDAAALHQTAENLTTYGDGLHNAGQGLNRIDTTSGWSGPAADAFRAVFHGEPAKWLDAGDAFHTAAGALQSYAGTLTWAQSQAADAIRLWNQGQAATDAAVAAHAQAVKDAQTQAMASGSLPVPMLPFADPGAGKRSAAEEMLHRARGQLDTAGKTAAEAVGQARDKAPQKPGFWDKVGSALSGFGHDVANVGEQVVNSAASVGNAIIHHPGDLLSIAGGLGLTAISSVGEGVGTGLDATGVGAVAGVPLNAVSAVGIASGVGLVGVGVGDLAQHAAGDNRVQAMQSNSSSSGGGSGSPPSKTDRIAEHLTPKDLEGAQRELNGEVVATKGDGTPFDHVTEVREAQRGLTNRIDAIQRQLGDTRTSDTARASLQSELSQASKLLDYSKKYVPTN